MEGLSEVGFIIYYKCAGILLARTHVTQWVVATPMHHLVVWISPTFEFCLNPSHIKVDSIRTVVRSKCLENK